MSATARDATTLRQRGEELLREMLGPGARFREGQWEAIHAAVLDRSRVLVVQRTGWGKSVVYFIAAKLLREAGAGTALLISPLVALMRNQTDMAGRIGVEALTIHSQNKDFWDDIEARATSGECDILLISPERLGNERFVTKVLPAIEQGVGLFVVDEAHCISDWGHDFRPDYRRIVRILQGLPSTVPVIATTATANDRVVQDVELQLGPGLLVQRGPLARDSLSLQAIRLTDQAERMAWLAEHLEGLPGSGIVYCLTVADCERVGRWLESRGLNVRAYHSNVGDAERVAREQMLLDNEVKALVATVALGMGFDKPDLGFVVHFQRPGSVVTYYQQIGRAGRAVDEAYAILLNGREDDEIQDYFIRTAFPPADQIRQVLRVIEESEEGLRLTDIEQEVNLPRGRLQHCLKHLQVEGAVVKDGPVYSRTARPWEPDIERSRLVTAIRRRELDRIREFVISGSCMMQFVAKELDDPDAAPCGRCASCRGELVPVEVGRALTLEAIAFLRRSELPIHPRKRWALGGSILAEHGNEEGRALCIYGDAGWGKLVRAGKYEDGRFDDELVAASAAMIRERWTPDPPPTWVTAVPSRRRPQLVEDLARRLAERLGLPFRAAIHKIADTPPQKEMENSVHQYLNVADAFEADEAEVRDGPVLLVDDMVDSRWTLTVCGQKLREAGSGRVHPFALASSAQSGGDS